MSRISPDATCATCRFWRPAGELMGQCRRKPPMVFGFRGQQGRPQMPGDDWCGEWVGMPDRTPDIPRPDEVNP